MTFQAAVFAIRTKEVSARSMTCIMTASFRATATAARLKPMRSISFSPHVRRSLSACLRVRMTIAAIEKACHVAVAAPGYVTIRPQALNRALRNLFDNAVRYGDAEAPIADNGPGLPDDQLEAVFEPFVRLEGSRSRDTGGVGLGLAIARTIIQAHGGTVILRNRLQGGLEAVVTLPIEAA